MGSLSVTAQKKLINHVFRAAYVVPSAVYLCLCTADPTESGTSANMHETAEVGGYARQAIVFSEAASRSIVQTWQVNFPKVTETYGSAITHWAICSSDIYGSGDMLAFGSLNTSITPTINNVYYVEAGEVEITIESDADAGWTDYAVHLMLDMMFRDQEWETPKDAIYIALATAAIEHDDNETTDITEQDATDYSRINVTDWKIPDDGQTENGSDIIMTSSITTEDWTGDVATAIVTAASGTAYVLCYDNVNIPEYTPVTGDDVKYAAGDLVVVIN